MLMNVIEMYSMKTPEGDKEIEVVNTNLLDKDRSTRHRWMVGEKTDRSHPSVMSPGRDGMSGRTAKVKPRPEPPPQNPGGRFLGTYAQGP